MIFDVKIKPLIEVRWYLWDKTSDIRLQLTNKKILSSAEKRIFLLIIFTGLNPYLLGTIFTIPLPSIPA